jgi:hypothetical protein
MNRIFSWFPETGKIFDPADPVNPVQKNILQ